MLFYVHYRWFSHVEVLVILAWYWRPPWLFRWNMCLQCSPFVLWACACLRWWLGIALSQYKYRMFYAMGLCWTMQKEDAWLLMKQLSNSLNTRYIISIAYTNEAFQYWWCISGFAAVMRSVQLLYIFQLKWLTVAERCLLVLWIHQVVLHFLGYTLLGQCSVYCGCLSLSSYPQRDSIPFVPSVYVLHLKTRMQCTSFKVQLQSLRSNYVQ